MVVLVDTAGSVLYVNQAVRRISNRPLEQLIGQSGFTCLHPDDIGQFKGQFATVLHQPLTPATARVRLRARGGVYRLFEVVAVNHLNDSIGAIVLNGRDITDAEQHEAEARQARAEVEASEARFRVAAACASDLIYEWHVDSGRLEWFGPIDGHLGDPDGSLPRTTEAWMDIIHPQDRPRVAAMLEEVLQTGALFHMEYRVRRADGGELTWLDRGRLVRHEKGLRRFVGAVSDLTERRALEAQLLQSQKMEAIGRLAGGVAHDFNNILTVIIGNTAVIAHDPGACDESREALADIDAAAERGAKLTRQLLAFSRQQVLQRRVLDVNRVVRDTERMLGRLLGEQIRISSETRSGPLLVLADATQLEQVLLNLAINARDAMPDGGTLVIRTDAVTVEEGAARRPGEAASGDYVTVSVTDSGVGMPEDVRVRVFEPFFTTKGVFGSGLGLATAYGIVRQSGGFLECESIPGDGSTFTIWLPRLQPRNNTEQHGATRNNADASSEQHGTTEQGHHGRTRDKHGCGTMPGKFS